MRHVATTFILTLLSSCVSSPRESGCYMNISVVRDVTDLHVLRPEANSILNLYNLSEHKRQGGVFRYREISDRVLVPAVDIAIPDESTTGKKAKRNQEFYRERIILDFYDSVRKTLAIPERNTDSTLLDHSECFKTIAEELTRLSKSNSKNKILLVFSNLFENSDILSVYRIDNGHLYIQEETVIQKLEKTNLLPKNLTGIKVFFVFQPTSRTEDRNYLAMVSIYKQLLESRGAKVEVQANNTHFI